MTDGENIDAEKPEVPPPPKPDPKLKSPFKASLKPDPTLISHVQEGDGAVAGGTDTQDDPSLRSKE
jgi:hypothetical protein